MDLYSCRRECRDIRASLSGLEADHCIKINISVVSKRRYAPQLDSRYNGCDSPLLCFGTILAFLRIFFLLYAHQVILNAPPLTLKHVCLIRASSGNANERWGSSVALDYGAFLPMCALAMLAMLWATHY